MLKSIARRAVDLYFFPLRKSGRLRTYVKGVFLVDPSQHLSATIRYIKNHVVPSPEEIVIDVGGAGGGTSIYFSEAFPDLRVFCIEPNPRMVSSLKKVESEHKNIVLTPLALGRTPGEATLHVTANDVSSSLNEINTAALKDTPADFQENLHEDQQVKVRISTLDEEFKNHRSVLLIKLDTQGTELEILEGGVATLGRTQFVLIEMNNHNLYQNTCQYYEVDGFLREHQFKLADIIVTYRGDDGVTEYDALYRNVSL